MPDPASGMEMDPEFVRLCMNIYTMTPGGQANAARESLWRWHLDAVERAVREAVEAMARGIEKVRLSDA